VDAGISRGLSTTRNFLFIGARVSALLAVPLLVFAIMYLFMIDKFARRFEEQAALARQNWAGFDQ
jgi:succinate dehydrogenase hydrophobic anchor subunit